MIKIIITSLFIFNCYGQGCDSIFSEIFIKQDVKKIKDNWNNYTNEIKKQHLGFNYSVPKSMPFTDFVFVLENYIKENESEQIYKKYLEIIYFPFSNVIKQNINLFSKKEKVLLDLVKE